MRLDMITHGVRVDRAIKMLTLEQCHINIEANIIMAPVNVGATIINVFFFFLAKKFLKKELILS